MSLRAQAPHQTTFAGPPVFPSANHYERVRRKNTAQDLPRVAAEKEPDCRLHRALAGERLKTAAVPFRRNRRLLDGKPPGDFYRGEHGNAPIEPAGQRAG